MRREGREGKEEEEEGGREMSANCSHCTVQHAKSGYRFTKQPILKSCSLIHAPSVTLGKLLASLGPPNLLNTFIIRTSVS